VVVYERELVLSRASSFTKLVYFFVRFQGSLQGYSSSWFFYHIDVDLLQLQWKNLKNADSSLFK
jgi:hypothetical protein